MTITATTASQIQPRFIFVLLSGSMGAVAPASYQCPPPPPPPLPPPPNPPNDPPPPPKPPPPKPRPPNPPYQPPIAGPSHHHPPRREREAADAMAMSRNSATSITSSSLGPPRGERYRSSSPFHSSVTPFWAATRAA